MSMRWASAASSSANGLEGGGRGRYGRRRARIAESKDKARAVIASKLAAKIYGLEILREDIEDEDHNTTRFIVLSAAPQDAELGMRRS